MHGYNIDTEKRKTCPISFKHALTVSANIAILQGTWNNYEIPTAIEPKNPFAIDIEQRAKRLFADHIALQQIDLVHPTLLYGKTWFNSNSQEQTDHN